MASLGDTLYRHSSVWKRLVGNTTTTRKVLCQTGTGAASAAPTWEDVGFIQRAVITRTDAQIKALPTTAATLVAAPGSGFRVEPWHVAVTVNTAAGAYTNIHANAYLHVHTSDWYNDWFDYLVNGNGTSVTEVTGFLGGAARKRWRPKPAIYPGATKFSVAYGGLAMVEVATSPDNAPLILYCDNAGAGNFTGGNAANTMTIECAYVIVPVY